MLSVAHPHFQCLVGPRGDLVAALYPLPERGLSGSGEEALLGAVPQGQGFGEALPPVFGGGVDALAFGSDPHLHESGFPQHSQTAGESLHGDGLHRGKVVLRDLTFGGDDVQHDVLRRLEAAGLEDGIVEQRQCSRGATGGGTCTFRRKQRQDNVFCGFSIHRRNQFSSSGTGRVCCANNQP